MPDSTPSTSVRMQATLDPIPGPLAGGSVIGLTGVERMCAPSVFEVEIEVPDYRDGGDGLTALLQKPVGIALAWVDDEGNPAPLEKPLVRDGVITEVTYLGTRTGGSDREVGLLRLRICDALALAGVGQRTRAHVEVSIADLAQWVAMRVDVTLDCPGAQTHPRLVQWQESDLDFLTRTIVRHGGFYWTKPGERTGDQRVIVGSSPSGYGATGDRLEAHCIRHGDSGEHQGVRNFMRREGLIPRQVVHREHYSPTSEFTQVVTSSLGGPAQARVEATELVHRVPTAPTWMGAAGKLAEAREGNRVQFSGESTYTSLHAGRCLELDLDWPDAETRYLVTEVRHELSKQGGSLTYGNRFACVPYGATWHPWPLPPRPQVAGMRLAVVTANDVVADAASYEGSTLEQAVYEVRFPAERDWDGTELRQRARFSQPAAGPDRGLHVPLEKDDEVVVVHEDGDPDRPLIIGALYSLGRIGPAVAVQDGTAIASVLRSRTGHELRFVDEPGKERIALTSGTGDHGLTWDDANKNMSLGTQGDLKENVKGDHSTKVQGTQSVEVTGDQSTKVSGARSAKVSGNDSATVDGSWSITATGSAGVKSSASASVQAPKIAISADGSISISVGGASISMDPGSITIKAPKITINGATISVAGDAKVAVSAPMAELSGTGQAKVSGGMIQVSASGPLQLLGAMITNNG